MKEHIVASLTLLILDLLWLKLYMGGRYSKMIPSIQGSPMVTKGLPAVLAYVSLVVGLCVFVLPAAKREGYTWRSCLKYGGLFGLVVYGVYDCTCGAVFSKWDMALALQDVLWGGFLFTIASYTAGWASRPRGSNLKYFT